MRRLTLLTHAPTPDLRSATFPANTPIHFKAVAYTAPRLHHIFTGPEHRTRATAEALGLPAQTHAALADLDYGQWTGKTLDQIAPDDLTSWLTDPNAAPHSGESVTQLLIRTSQFLSCLEEGHTLAVTHPAVVRAAVLHVLAAPPASFWRVDIAPLTLTDLRYNGRGWTLRSLAVPLQSPAHVIMP